MTSSAHDLRGRVIVIGAGVAGLMTALRLAPHPVLLLSKAPLGDATSSAWAQGGLAAALGADDTPHLHLGDTLAAGDGHCDAAFAARFTQAAPGAIEALVKLGVPFDRRSDGGFNLGLEAAHCRRRIAHAGGDSSGRELMRVLVGAVRSMPSVEALEGYSALRLCVEDNAMRGVLAIGPAGPETFAAGKVVIATGGIGGLYLDSTNPLGSFGQGLALAAAAGADLADLEFVQFHPTAFDGPVRPMPLVSEAVRGEGAILIDETGRRFLEREPGAELAPRDVVARAIWRQIDAGHRVFLDARPALGASFAKRFPVIAAFCASAGIDPAQAPIPVRPAEHYHMGGIAVDGDGLSSIDGLWACGEAACNGLHGANRLASNSLTEAVVCAGLVAENILGAPILHAPPPRVLAPPPPPDPSLVRPILSAAAGVMRDGAGLAQGLARLLPLALGEAACVDPARVALMILVAALRRKESRGAHCRTDFPERAGATRRARLRLDDAIAAAHEIAPAAFSWSA